VGRVSAPVEEICDSVTASQFAGFRVFLYLIKVLE